MITKKLNQFPCGVKHNFNTGDIFEKDRKIYDWNCTSCELKKSIEHGKSLKDFKIDGKVICPGIRPDWYQEADDQKRTMTPKEAVTAGADLLVIGRPILRSDNVLEAIERTNEEVES